MAPAPPRAQPLDIAPEVKHKRNQLQLGVLKRLEAGLPPTRWQQLRLHLQTAWRRRYHWSIHSSWFHVKGVARVFWRPFTIFRFSRVPVQIHGTFLIYPVGFFTWCECKDNAIRGLLWSSVALLLFSFSLLVHEFAHVFAARHWGIGTRRVIMIPLGFVAELESMPRAPGEIWIGLAGPLASLTLAGVFWLALHAMGSSIKYWLSGRYWLLELRQALGIGYSLNLMVGIFNLLPCFPMDGGRVLRSALAVLIGRVFPQHAGQAFLIATRIAVRYVTWLAGLGMMALTIFSTRIWIHLVTFPLLILYAEVDYWILRANKSPSGIDDL